MPGNANQVFNALAMEFAKGIVNVAGRKAFESFSDFFRDEADAAPSQLTSVPEWSYMGSAFWGQDGFYYLQTSTGWFVLHPDRTNWIQIQSPNGQLFDQQDIYLGSNGITYLQSAQGLFALSPRYGWVQVS